MDNGGALIAIGTIGMIASLFMYHMDVRHKEEILARKHVAWTLECAKSCEDAGLRVEAVSFGSNPSCDCR